LNVLQRNGWRIGTATCSTGSPSTSRSWGRSGSPQSCRKSGRAGLTEIGEGTNEHRNTKHEAPNTETWNAEPRNLKTPKIENPQKEIAWIAQREWKKMVREEEILFFSFNICVKLKCIKFLSALNLQNDIFLGGLIFLLGLFY
jgi:hypothetical protein